MLAKALQGTSAKALASYHRLATKPVVGMFDFASNVSEGMLIECKRLIAGVRNTTTLFDRDPLDKVRRPRFIAKDGVVRPYSSVEGISCISFMN